MIEDAHTIDGNRSKWSQISWRRIVLALAVIFACMASLLPVAWFLEPWYFAREISRDDPSLSVTPVALPTNTASALAPGRLQCFEFSFQAPWNNIGSRKDSRSATIIRFTNGPSILAFAPDSIPTRFGADGKTSKKLEEILGQRVVSSGYEWMAAKLGESPAEIHWWNRTGNVRATVLLGLKSTEMLHRSAIYKVMNEEVHGFQIGQPGPGPVFITLELFDVNNRRYQMIIGTQPGGQLVTQADINAIVASLRPIPHS
jgi:hypothetical protein